MIQVLHANVPNQHLQQIAVIGSAAMRRHLQVLSLLPLCCYAQEMSSVVPVTALLPCTINYKFCPRYDCRQTFTGVVPATAAGRQLRVLSLLWLQAGDYRCCSRYGCRQETKGVVLVTAAGRQLQVSFSLRLQADITGIVPATDAGRHYWCCPRYGCRQATTGVVPATAAGRHYRCCSRYGCRQDIINMFSLRLQADIYRCCSRYGCRQALLVLSPLRLQADITGVVPATAAGRK